ncbi:MAG: hypothetical protein HY589_01070, partial [Candidatus Omnitrophica bacterium]|nr:hypothetical protein [Candidatus Omnitrophota bacterium]
HGYNTYYAVSKPRNITEDNNNWIIYFPQKGKSFDDSFDLRCIVNITSIKVEIDKTRLSIISSRHRDESLLGTMVVAECAILDANDSIYGCILYLGGLGATRLEAIIPKDGMKSFFDKCGPSIDKIGDYYGGKRITITGVLAKIGGSPMIVVHSPGQIEVITPTGKILPGSGKGTYGGSGFFGKF